MILSRIPSRFVASLAACVGITLPSACSYHSSCTNGSTPLRVDSRPANLDTDVLSSSGISVSAGTRISFQRFSSIDTPLGSYHHAWNVGFGFVGPEGHPGQSNAGCPAKDGPIGSLVGRIGPHEEDERGAEKGTYFAIGLGTTYVAEKNGMLYLGANDNSVGQCGTGKHSCYEDNRGFVDMCVTVTK